MKKWAFPLIAASAMMAVGCNFGGKTAGNDTDDADSVYMLDGPGSYMPAVDPDEQAAQEKAVVEKVAEIYQAVAKAYANTGEYGSDTNLDEQFCSDDWNAKVDAIHQKDMAIDEIGFFEADYWVMGQGYVDDIHATDIKLEKIEMEQEPWRAAVTLKLHNFEPIPIRVDLVYEKGDWKVDDLTDLKNDFDWKKDMEEYLNE